jgi:hypothetical protein
MKRGQKGKPETLGSAQADAALTDVQALLSYLEDENARLRSLARHLTREMAVLMAPAVSAESAPPRGSHLN